MTMNIVAFVPTGDYESNTRRRMLAAVARALRRRGRGERMLCVERPLCPISTAIKHPRKFLQWLTGRRGLRQVAPNVWAWTPAVFIHDMIALRHYSLRRANNWALRATLQRVLSVLRMHKSDRGLVSWVFHPWQIDYLTLARESLRVYECYDEYAEFPGIAERPREPERLLALEGDLARGADLVLATSEQLAERLRRLNPRVRCVANGVDFEHFRAGSGAPEPQELSEIPRPIIGFVGKLNECLDFSVLDAVAWQRRDWSFAFLAPFDGTPKLRRAPQFQSLLNRSNVHLLGWQPYSRVPAFVAAFDVCTIPFVLNTLTNAIYPLKLHEYLAVGKPVVATPTRELRGFSDMAYLADTPEAFIESIERALVEDCPQLQEQRIAVAKANSWEVRAREILLHIEEAAEDR